MSAETVPQIKRPPRRPKGSAKLYSRTTITLSIPTMRQVLRNARRKNLTISGYIETLVVASLAKPPTKDA